MARPIRLIIALLIPVAAAPASAQQLRDLPQLLDSLKGGHGSRDDAYQRGREDAERDRYRDDRYRQDQRRQADNRRAEEDRRRQLDQRTLQQRPPFPRFGGPPPPAMPEQHDHE